MNSPAGVHAADADSSTALERTLFALTLLLVGMAAFTGGGSQDREAGDAATQLLARDGRHWHTPLGEEEPAAGEAVAAK